VKIINNKYKINININIKYIIGNSFKTKKIKFLDFIEFFKAFGNYIYYHVYNNIIYK